MPRAPDSPTDTYLDVLRTLGVTDAALRRHHDAGPETPLRVAIDADRGSPTADLLAALEATGRLLDLRDGLDSDDVDRLTSTLAHFGLRVESAEAGDAASAADDADDRLELLVTDDVSGATDRITTATDSESVLDALRTELPDAGAIAFVELLDGRHLVADRRDLDALAERYGPRVQPFDDPLLVPDAAIEVDGSGESTGTTSPAATDSVSPPAPAAPAPAAPDAEAATDRPTSSTEAPTPASDDGESFGEFVSAVDDSAAEAVLADDEPETHTIEGDGEDVDVASTSSIGGGPRRTVSTSGIDDVFDQLESSAPADDAASTTIQTMSESSDPPTDPGASADDAATTQNGLAGGPTRTVSSTSADDILEQATGDSDFETIAAEAGDADPDAVLADAEEVPPALEDAEVAAEFSPGESESAAADGEEAVAPDVEELPATARGPAGAADVPPADPMATADDVSEEAIAAPPADDSVDSDEIHGDDAGGTEDPAPADAATPMPSADTPNEEQPSTLEDDLLEDDVELRRGSEAVEGPVAPEADGIDVDSDESADADGPLAAAGGVSPPDATSGEAEAEERSTPTAMSAATGGEDSIAADASNVESAEADESAECNDSGLVGRLTSTIFGG